MIQLIHVRNPLQPSVDRETTDVSWAASRSLEEYVELALSSRGTAPAAESALTVSLNGKVISPSLLSLVTPRDGDCIVVVPKLAGGSVLRDLAMVAVVAAAIAATALTAGALAGPAGAWAGPTMTAVLAGMAGGAVSIAGNLLISAFLNNPSQKSNSPTYAFDGPHSLAQSGTVIPKGYGKMDWGGNIIASFVDVEGKDQYINALACYGYGPGRKIADILINGKPITEYGNVTYYTRLGSNNQTAIPNFNRIVNGYPQNARCLAGVPVIVPGTGTLTQILQVDVVFPSGLWVLTNNNNLIPATLTYLVEYALHGSAKTFAATTTSGSTHLVGTAYIGDIPIGTPITGPGIPAGATLAGFTVSTYGTAVLSVAATATGAGTFTAVGAQAWQPVVQPSSTTDIVTYHLDGTPYPYPTWVAMATDLPPGSGVVYAHDSGSHTPGDPFSITETVQVDNPDGTVNSYGKVCTGEWQLTVPNLNLVQVNSWTAGYQSATACNQSPVYNRTSIYGLAAGKYDTRLIKYGSARWGDAGNINPGDNWSPQIGQDMWIHSVNEIALLDLAYPNMILIGVRALATGQLSGSALNITATITHGLRTLDNNVLPGALQAFEEDNPACVAADMMLDKLYGGGQSPGIVEANINRFIDEWVAWAELNDELVDDGNGGSIRRHVFNGVFDSESNLWDQLNVVGHMSRAQLIPLGRDYGVFLDQADVPVQIFTMGNIAQDSFNETWMQIDDRANQVEIQFADSTRYWKQDNPMVYMDPANQDAGVVVKNVRIDGKGITIPAQAWHLARYKERCNQFLLRTGSFKCDVDAIASRPGNVAILQHDVPEWGWGGRTLPGSTVSNVFVDRDDLPFTVGPSYSLIVLFAAIERYAGTITGVTAVIDATGANTGTRLSLSSFDNANRVTRAVVVAGGVSFDCPITATGAGLVVIQPVPGFTAAPGQTYTLFDTDVLETATVIGVSALDGSLILGTPLSQPPSDYSTYFYGIAGTQKLVRIVNIRKASEFRATVEWIDYDARVYVDATPVIGSTSAQSSSNPGVTRLTGSETIQHIAGNYVSSAALTWINGPDTVGVGIYATFLHNISGAPAGQPQMVARLTNQATHWTAQVSPGTVVEYTVVGFDVKDRYAGFNSAPTITIAVEGIATNLLLGSTFATGFTYWNVTPRSGDALAPDLSNDGEATYTVAISTLSVPQVLLYQPVPQSKWAIGSYLMLSGFFEDSAVSTANVGNLQASIAFFDASGTLISKVSAVSAMNGITPLLNRYVTASTIVPPLTASVVVLIEVAGAGLSIPVGSVLTFSHLLLEASTPTQTLPSLWAEVDVQGAVIDYFTTGSSTGLRVQGSVLPSFSGSFTTANASTNIAVGWASLAVLWPDRAVTYIADSTYPAEAEVVGLTPGTTYFVFMYWDIVQAKVLFAPVAAPVGTSISYGTGGPGAAAIAYDPVADAACRQDGRAALTPGGMQVTTTATGFTSTGAGGGYSGGGPPLHGTPIPGQSLPY